MGRLIYEAERTDFIPTEWELYDKGIKSLNRTMLTPENQLRFNYSDECYILLGKDKHYLKR